jgi:ABC-type glycerol-3-phosphate transport system substrate-binding protein
MTVIRRVAVGTLVLLLAASLASAGGQTEGSAPKTVKIRFASQWAPGSRSGEFAYPALEAFLAEHPEIELVHEIVTGDELRNKIRADAAAGNLPDLWTYWIDPSIMGDLVKAGLLLDMAEYLKVSKTFQREQIGEGYYFTPTIDGTLYGIPGQAYMAYFLYNKDILGKFGLNYPKTYEEMLAIGKVLKANDIIPLNVASKGGNPSHLWFSELYYQLPNGIEEIRNIGKSYNFATKNMFTIARLIDDMRRNGIFPKDTIASGDWGPSFSLYNEGRAAFCYSYSWMSGTMKPEIEKASVIIPVPKIPGADKDPANFITSGANYGFVINKKSFQDPVKQPQIVKLMDFFLSEKVVQAVADQGELIVNNRVNIDPARIPPLTMRIIQYARDKNLQFLLGHYAFFPDPKSFNDFQTYLDELFAGTMNPDDFVNKMQQSFDRAKAAQ